MTKKSTFVMPLLLVTAATTAAFYTMLNSFDKGETWRIAAAVTGFAGFLFLNVVVAVRFFRQK